LLDLRNILENQNIAYLFFGFSDQRGYGHTQIDFFFFSALNNDFNSRLGLFVNGFLVQIGQKFGKDVLNIEPLNPGAGKPGDFFSRRIECFDDVIQIHRHDPAVNRFHNASEKQIQLIEFRFLFLQQAGGLFFLFDNEAGQKSQNIKRSDAHDKVSQRIGRVHVVIQFNERLARHQFIKLEVQKYPVKYTGNGGDNQASFPSQKER